MNWLFARSMTHSSLGASDDAIRSAGRMPSWCTININHLSHWSLFCSKTNLDLIVIKLFEP